MDETKCPTPESNAPEDALECLQRERDEKLRGREITQSAIDAHVPAEIQKLAKERAELCRLVCVAKEDPLHLNLADSLKKLAESLNDERLPEKKFADLENAAYILHRIDQDIAKLEARIAAHQSPSTAAPSGVPSGAPGGPEKKIHLESEAAPVLQYGDKWWKQKLEAETVIQFEPPFEEYPPEYGGMDFCSPSNTAMHGYYSNSLVKTKNEHAYKTVCSFDNLWMVNRLEFLTTDSVLIEACVVSALSSPNAGYRVAGYLLNPIYPLPFLDPDHSGLAGSWAKGFDDLSWPEDSWLDTLKDGPKYERDKNNKLIPTTARLNTSESMPLEIRASVIAYKKLDYVSSWNEAKVDENARNVQKQQFLNQASKLFVLAEYFGYGETLLMCSFFRLPAPSSGHQFTYKGQVQTISQKAAESAAKVITRLIGWY